MAKDEKQKAEEILAKRRAAAKGLKEQPSDRPADPMATDTLTTKRSENPDREQEVAENVAVASIAVRRSG